MPAAPLAAPQAAVDQFFFFILGGAACGAAGILAAGLLVEMLPGGVTTRYYPLLPVITRYYPLLSLARLAGDLQATCGDLQATCRRLAGDLQATCRRLAATCRRLAGTCRRLAGDLQATCRRLAGDLQATCRRLAGDLRGLAELIEQIASPSHICLSKQHELEKNVEGDAHAHVPGSTCADGVAKVRTWPCASVAEAATATLLSAAKQTVSDLGDAHC